MKIFFKMAAVSTVLLWGPLVFAQKEMGSAGKICNQISNMSKEVAAAKLTKAETFNEKEIKGTATRTVTEGDGKSEDWILTQKFEDTISPVIYKAALRNKLKACFGEPKESSPHRALIWPLANKSYVVLSDEKTLLHLRVTKSLNRKYVPADAATQAELDKKMWELLDYVPPKKN